MIILPGIMENAIQLFPPFREQRRATKNRNKELTENLDDSRCPIPGKRIKT